MVSDPTAFWSAIAAGGSAVAAFVSLVVAWQARSIQGASADFSNCLEVTEQLRAAEARVRDAEGDKRTFEFNALLNLFEALATLHNDRKLAPSTRKIVGNYLVQVLSWIRNDEGMKRLMEASVTSGQTYEELDRFEKRHTNEMLEHSRRYAIQRGNR